MVKQFAGVNEGLAELKQMGMKIGIVTSKLRPMVMRGIELIGIGEYLDVIISPEDTKLHKPNPEPALKASELLCLEPHECVMVGDSVFDISCGKQAGMKAIGVSYSLTSIEELNKFNPDLIVDSIADIPDWIRGINAKRNI